MSLNDENLIMRLSENTTFEKLVYLKYLIGDKFIMKHFIIHIETLYMRKLKTIGIFNQILHQYTQAQHE